MGWESRSEGQIEVDEKKGKKILKEKIIIQDKRGQFVRANIIEYDKDKGVIDREVDIYDIKTDKRRVLKRIKGFIKFKPRIKVIETANAITLKYDEDILKDEEI